ncbi:PadR family transcriptional regulator [Streptomyces sp. NPDC095817]|uniref:PadR family transcriptional regulator n=1 Tax=Streptomyces sp. NPDC095817 TaxID=3155082 RepID=UPI00331AEB0D
MSLPISAYVVLGLLSKHDGATPYQLDQSIRDSIGYFWVFPRSQLYAEAGRLVRKGLIVEHQEETGRRRRTLSITDKGRCELEKWLACSTPVTTEIHDEGLLRLYFQPLRTGESAADPSATADAIRRLAEEQIQGHRGQLAAYREIIGREGMVPGSPQYATLELGLRFEKMIIKFWSEIASSPADLPAGNALGQEA